MVFCSALLEICTHVDLVIFKTANKKYLAKPIPLLLNDRLIVFKNPGEESILFLDSYDDERIYIRVYEEEITYSSTRIEVLNKYLKSEQYKYTMEAIINYTSIKILDYIS